MPKLKNVTLAELEAAAEAALDAGQEAAAVLRPLEQGYHDDIPTPLRLASSFLAASATLAEVARQLLVKAALAEQKAELEKRLRADA